MKKIFKCTLAILLAVVMTIGSAPLNGLVDLELTDWFGFKARASSNVDYSDLTQNQYMAKVILNHNYKGVLNDYGKESRTPQQLLYENLYYKPEVSSGARVIYNEYASDNSFTNLMTIYEILTFDPSKLMNLPLKLDDYYSAVLFDILDAKISDSNFSKSIKYSSAETITDLSGIVYEYLKNSSGASAIDLDKKLYTSLSKEEINKIVELIDKHEAGEMIYESTGKDLGILSKILSAGKTVADSLENLGRYLSLATSEQSLKNFLEALKANCPDDNLLLKNAVTRVCDYVCEEISIYMLGAIETGKALYEISVDIIISEAWEKCLTSVLGHYGAGILIGQAIGQQINNFCFATDATTERLLAIGCMVEVEDVVLSAVKDLASKFKNDESEENADAFIRSLQILLTTYDLGHDYVKNFIEVAYTGGAISNFLHGDDEALAYWREIIQKRKNNIQWDTLSITSKYYKVPYEVDAPSAYKQYYGANKNIIPTVYSQLNDYKAYNYPGGSGSTYRSSGCGVYAIVNAVKYLTGKKIDPHKLGEYAIECGARVNGGTIATTLAKKSASHSDFGNRYGYEVSKIYYFKDVPNKMKYSTGSWVGGYPSSSEWNEIYNMLVTRLNKGEVAVVHVYGHYMAIVDYDNVTDRFLILDSAPYTSKRLYENKGKYQWVTSEQLNYNCAPTANAKYNNQNPYIHLRSDIIFLASTSPTSNTFDVNYTLNGKPYNKSNNIFTFDVYVNNTKVANDVSDFCKSYYNGTAYKIDDIKFSEGYDYSGVSKGKLEGTITNSDVEVELKFVTPEAPELIDTVYFGNSKYDLYSGNVSWSYAEFFAENKRGHLAEITSLAEQNIIKDLSSTLSAVWLGGTDEYTEGVWRWSGNENFSYSNWASGEPNNNDGSGNDENYLGMTSSTGYWNDYRLYSPSVKGFIVETNVGESHVSFNVNHDSINVNLFRSPCETITVNGITYSYNKSTQILTLNGTTSQDYVQIGSVPFWVSIGDTYTASCYYVSGSVTNGELCYDVCGSNGNRLSSRKYLSCKNVNSSTVWNFTEADSTDTTRENAAGSYLKLWVDNSTSETNVVFNNYKIKIKLEKGSKPTPYSPARNIKEYGEGYGSLPTIYRDDYTFAGWYTSPTDGYLIENSTLCESEKAEILYAHWIPNKSVVSFDLNYSDINTNLFRSIGDEVVVDDIVYSYDAEEETLTLNGSSFNTVSEIGKLPFWVNVGDVYTASCYYISGSVTNGALCYDVCGKDGYRLSNRKNLSCQNADASAVWTFTELDPTDEERENAAGSYVKLWVYNSTNGDNAVVFDNYKIKIKLEKGNKATEHSPTRLEFDVGETYSGLPQVKREGYIFDGWYTKAEGGELITETTVCASDDYKIFYAHWTPREWTTTFNLNYDNIGANLFRSPCEEITVNGITYSYDEKTEILTLNGTTSQDVTQIGSVPFWVYVGDTYTASCYYVSGSVTGGELCYDVCGKDGYRLSNRKYLACKNANSSATWNFTVADPTNTETENAAGSSLKLWVDNNTSESDVVFNNYKIKLKLEKGSSATTYSPARKILSTGNIAEKIPAVTRNGYSFAGWYTAPTGGSIITASSIFTSNEYRTLYARWMPIKYKITFAANGGNCDTVSKEVLYSSTYGTLPTPTRTGYMFNGWFTAKTGGSKITSSSTVSVTGNHTLYAQWTINTYTVTYDANGGIGTPSNQTKTYGTALTLSSTNPTRTGYTFNGWNTKADGTGTSYAAGASYTANSAATLYAQWTINTFTVSFDANGGTGAPSAQIKTYGTNLTLSSTKPTRTGYTFIGWNTKADGTGTSYTAGASYTQDTAITLYAQWDINIYVVSYDANGGAGAPSDQNKTYGTSLTLSVTKPVKTGYSFIGWNTKSDGTGTSYAAGGNYTANAAVTLYAQWKANTYTITFNANGGSCDTESKAVTYASAYGTLPSPTRSGYMFNGWYTSSSGGTKITSSSTVSITSAQTLYAQWTEIVLTSVVLKSLPTTTSYYVGDTLNTSGLTLIASYNDGTNKTVNSGFTCTPTTLNNAGAQEITVTYGGKTTSFDVTVENVMLSGVEIKSNPTNTAYYVGDTLDTAGLTLTANYNNGTSKVVSSGFTCTPTSFNTAGNQDITVSYGGKTATFNVTVTAVMVSSVSIKTTPTNMSYFVSDTLDTSGLTLMAKYNNGTTETISSGFSCSPTALNKAGTQEVTVTFGGKTTSFDVNVESILLTSIKIKSKPSKTSYFVGDILDITGLTLTAEYNNGTSETISNGFTCTPTMLDTAGTQEIIVVYGDEIAKFTVDVIAVSLSDITVKTMPLKVNYYVGDSLSTEGLVLTATYNNGEVETVTNGFACDLTKLSTAGTHKITVTYGGKTTSFNVNVTEVIVSQIVISSTPKKASYFVGDTLSIEGLTLMVIYNNGKVETVTNGFTCTPTTLNTAGTQEITVTYGDKTATFSVTVEKVALSNISIKSNPTKTSYYIGDTFNASGLTLTVTYNNGATEIVSSGFVCTPSTLNTAGTQNITVIYDGKTAMLNVTVEEIVLSSVAIKSNPTKTSYYVGDVIDTSGLTLTATYNNGTTEIVAEEFTCTPKILNVAGTQEITVIYGGKTAKFNVTVEEVELSGITLKSVPTKTNYYVGDILDTSGLILVATYNNGTTEIITEGFTCTPTTLSTAGTQKITTTYSGKTTTFDVTVEDVVLKSITLKTIPTKMSYYVGDTLDTSGLTLTAIYNNGKSETISSGFICTPTTFDTVGAQKITVTYGGKATSFDVTVESVVLSSISIKNNPSKTDYYIGDTLDTTGLVLTATYNNGKSETISEGFTCTPTTLETAGTQIITVSYRGETATFNVTIEDVVLSSIAVKSMPVITSYYVGDSFDTTGLTLTATYNNGATAIISEGFTCTPTTFSTSGAQKITVTYGDKITTLDVTVEDVVLTGIEVKSYPSQISYFVGDVLNTSGLTLTATYNNGATKTVSGGFTCTPETLEIAGTQEITVTYGDKSTSFNVDVKAVEISGISIASVPETLNYFVGDTLSTEGLTILVTYNNGTTKTVTSGFTYTPTVLETEGTQKITVTYGDKTASFNISVASVKVTELEIVTVPEKTSYKVGDKFDPTGLTMNAVNSKGEEIVVSEGFVCTPEILDKAGTQVVTVSYGGKSVMITVIVAEAEPETYVVKFISNGEVISETTYVEGEIIVEPKVSETIGYTFTGWTPQIPDAMPAENLTFTAIWIANSYEAVFNANGGAWSDGATEKAVSTEYGADVIAPEAPVRDGYVFSGWTPEISIMDDVNGKTFTAIWTAATDIKYTVETYTMNTSGEYEKTSQIFSGATGESVADEYTVPTGFTLNAEKSVLEGTIAADNSLVLKAYIDRNTYTFTTVVDGVSTPTAYLYGSMVSEPVTPSKTDYKFIKWNGTIPETMPAENVTVTAVFEKSYICLDCGDEILGEVEINEHKAIEARMKATVKIKNNTGSNTIKYGETLRLTAITTNMPADVKVCWYVDGVKKGEGETFNISFENGTKNVEVKLVDSSGNVLKNASGNEIKDSESVTVKGGFFQKIISFFKNLFGMNRTVVQSVFKGVF